MYAPTFLKHSVTLYLKYTIVFLHARVRVYTARTSIYQHCISWLQVPTPGTDATMATLLKNVTNCIWQAFNSLDTDNTGTVVKSKLKVSTRLPRPNRLPLSLRHDRCVSLQRSAWLLSENAPPHVYGHRLSPESRLVMVMVVVYSTSLQRHPAFCCAFKPRGSCIALGRV